MTEPSLSAVRKETVPLSMPLMLTCSFPNRPDDITRQIMSTKDEVFSSNFPSQDSSACPTCIGL